MNDAKDVALALALLVAISPAVAQVPWSGETLREVCARERQTCAVYVRSVLDRYHEFIATHCPRQEVRFPEMLDAVVSDVAGQELERDRSAPELILGSIKQRYQCKW